MPSCEKCWEDSRSSYDSIATYHRLLRERGPDGCTPEEQAGDDAGTCERCGRKAIHQYVRDWCMACNAPSCEAALVKEGV